MITCLTSGSARRTPATTRGRCGWRTTGPGTLTAPAQAHWGHGLPFTMLANDSVGDCVEAGYAHQVQVWCDRAGQPFVPTDAEALGAYSAITGYNPDDPSTDQGTDMLTACNYWRSTGMAGHEVTAYLSVSAQNRDEVSESVAFYGGLYLGLALPTSAQSQVGATWTVLTGPDAAAGSWGGHCRPRHRLRREHPVGVHLGCPPGDDVGLPGHLLRRGLCASVEGLAGNLWYLAERAGMGPAPG